MNNEQGMVGNVEFVAFLNSNQDRFFCILNISNGSSISYKLYCPCVSSTPYIDELERYQVVLKRNYSSFTIKGKVLNASHFSIFQLGFQGNAITYKKSSLG